MQVIALHNLQQKHNCVTCSDPKYNIQVQNTLTK